MVTHLFVDIRPTMCPSDLRSVGALRSFPVLIVDQTVHKTYMQNMTSASKYFYKSIGTLTCSDLLHLNGESSCWEATVWNLTQTIGGCCKYVLPIATVSVVSIITFRADEIKNHICSPLDSTAAQDPPTRQACGRRKSGDFLRIFVGRLDYGRIWIEFYVLVLVSAFCCIC